MDGVYTYISIARKNQEERRIAQVYHRTTTTTIVGPQDETDYCSSIRVCAVT